MFVFFSLLPFLHTREKKKTIAEVLFHPTAKSALSMVKKLAGDDLQEIILTSVND